MKSQTLESLNPRILDPFFQPIREESSLLPPWIKYPVSFGVSVIPAPVLRDSFAMEGGKAGI